jgi:hypothetical protein
MPLLMLRFKSAIIFNGFLILFISINTACTHRIKAPEESYFITKEYSGTAPSKGDMLFKLNFSDSLFQQDTISMSYFKYAHHDIEDSYISLGLPDNYELKKVERHTIFTPTLKNFSFPNARMFFKLEDLAYTAKRPIHDFNPLNYKTRIFEDSPDANQEEVDEIKRNHKIFLKSKNVLHYPAIHLNRYIKKKFENISKNQLTNAIQIEISREVNMKKQERSYWRSQTKKYRTGSFAETKDPFDILYYTVYIDLELFKDDRLLHKVLKYEISVGP